MEKKSLDRLFKQYFDNKISDADEAMLFSYLATNPDHDLLEDILIEEWERTSDLGDFSAKRAHEIVNHILGRKRPVKRRLQNWMSLAAVLFLAILGMTYFIMSDHKTTDGMVKLEKIIAYQEHRKVILPDGSSVILNKNSKISFTPSLFNSKREVNLSGEALFDVQHDATRPFVVNAGELSTRVLGTSFNIKTTDGDRKVIVTVIRGKVMVTKDDTKIGILTPNHQVSYDSSVDRAKKLVVVSSQFIKWQSSDIYFNDVSMVEVMNELSMRFKTKILFADDVGKQCRITAKFIAGETLPEILKIISAYNGAQYKVNSTEIIISAKDCKQ